MDSSEIKDLLLVLAKARLANRPLAFHRFQRMLDTTVEGTVMWARIRLAPLSTVALSQLGHTEHLNEYLLGLIDEWASEQPLLQVTALPALPKSEGPAADVLLSQASGASEARPDAPAELRAVPLATEALIASTRGKRRDLLAPAIEDAQRSCTDIFDAPAVWAKLRLMAEQGRRPFIGVSEDGLKWVNSDDDTQFLSLNNLRDRLKRQKRALR